MNQPLCIFCLHSNIYSFNNYLKLNCPYCTMEGEKEADLKQNKSENCFDLFGSDNFEKYSDFDSDEYFDCSFHNCNSEEGKNFHILAFRKQHFIYFEH